MNLAKYWITLALLFAAIYGSFLGWRTYREAQATSSGKSIDSVNAGAGHAIVTLDEAEVGKAPDSVVTPFKLIDQDGRAFDSKSLDGQVWVTSFFFTSCPGACWIMNQTLAGIQQSMPESKVRFVSITCDPEEDSPAAMKAYADRLQADPARWTFLTGPMEDIEAIGKNLSVAVLKGTHSYRAIVVDRRGKIRGQFSITDPLQLEKLKKLLARLEEEPA